MSEHEAFDFGITLDGVHRPRIQCRTCFECWPCLTRQFDDLQEDHRLLRAQLADRAHELVSLREHAKRRWYVAKDAAGILGTDDPEQAVVRLKEIVQDRDEIQERYRRNLSEHHEFMNGMLNALDMDIDEDGEYILDQIVTKARVTREALAASEATVMGLREALEDLRETGPDEPLMDDPTPSGGSRYRFWFCGGTIRKGHTDDCPWQSAMALLEATTPAAAPSTEKGPTS